jgi:hypothetical protein
MRRPGNSSKRETGTQAQAALKTIGSTTFAAIPYMVLQMFTGGPVTCIPEDSQMKHKKLCSFLASNKSSKRLKHNKPKKLETAWPKLYACPCVTVWRIRTFIGLNESLIVYRIESAIVVSYRLVAMLYLLAKVPVVYSIVVFFSLAEALPMN